MLDFAKLCKQCEQLSTTERALMMAEKSAVVFAKLKVLSLPEIDPVETLAAFLIGSIFSDGKIDDREYLLLYPSLVGAFGADFDFESVKALFESDKQGIAEIKRCTKDIMTIIGCIDEDLQADLIALCLLITAIDGKISLKERRYIKQLCKC